LPISVSDCICCGVGHHGTDRLMRCGAAYAKYEDIALVTGLLVGIVDQMIRSHFEACMHSCSYSK
jgi:hypothetical protein